MKLANLGTPRNEDAPQKEASTPALSDFKLLPASALKINFDVQQREEYSPEDIKAFAESIKANKEQGRGVAGTGYEQPINVYFDPATKEYLVTFGGRRTMAGQCKEVWGDEDPFIPALISKKMDRKEAALSSIIENEDRVPPTPLEQTNSYLRLVMDLEMTPQQIAASRGWSLTAVNEILDRANYGPDLKQVMKERPDTKRIARDIHNKIGNKDPEKRREVIEMVLSGASYPKASKVIEVWVDEQKTKEAVQRQESKSQQESKSEGSTTSKSKDLRPQSGGTGGITFSRNNTPENPKLPEVKYETLASNVKYYSRQAFDVCQKVQPQGKHKRELLEAAREAQRNLENLIKILQAGKTTGQNGQTEAQNQSPQET